jgi:hypothetical protein
MKITMHMHAAHLLISNDNRLNVFANCISCAILYDSNFTQQFVAVSMSFRITSRLPSKDDIRYFFLLLRKQASCVLSVKNRANIAVIQPVRSDKEETSMKIEE